MRTAQHPCGCWRVRLRLAEGHRSRYPWGIGLRGLDVIGLGGVSNARATRSETAPVIRASAGAADSTRRAFREHFTKPRLCFRFVTSAWKNERLSPIDIARQRNKSALVRRARHASALVDGTLGESVVATWRRADISISSCAGDCRCGRMYLRVGSQGAAVSLRRSVRRPIVK